MRKVGDFWRGRTFVVLAVATGASVGLGPVSVAHAQSAPTLEQAFDNVGVTSPADPSAGNFDGIGDSFNASGLAEDALVPGESLLHDGLQFTWPDVAPGQPDNVVADGQTVAVSGQGSTLGIVGASAYGSASGTFTVTYANGSTTTANVTFADWVNSTPGTGNDFLATTGGWDPGGTIPVSLSYASVALNPSQPVVSVTLLTVAAGVGRNVNSMHIFDLTVGSPGAEASGAPGAFSSGSAWNQLIEVDGFGTDKWVTPGSPTAGLGQSGSLGTPQVQVASSTAPASSGETPGVISITVPAATLGAPGKGGSWSGWTFTVALTGQDGFGFDDARTFTPTPGEYTFGVCSQAVASEPNPPAICSYNPGSVPYVLDTIPPAGVDVQSELNPTLGPVVLQGVTVP